MANDQNKKLVSVNVTINWFFILVICHTNNFYQKDNSRD